MEEATWVPPASYVPLQYVVLGHKTITSPLVCKFAEWIKHAGKDDQLELEIVNDLCRLEDKELAKIFKGVSKIPFASLSCANPTIPSKRPAISLSANIIYSTTAELYTPLTASVRVGVTHAVREEETTIKSLRVKQHAKLGYDSGLSVYSSHIDLGTLYPGMECNVSLEFVICQQGARYRRLHLFEFGSNSSNTRCTYFRPLLCDITLASHFSDGAANRNSSLASSSGQIGGQIGTIHPIPHVAINLPLRRSNGGRKPQPERTEALPSPTAPARIPECLTWAQDLDQVPVGARLENIPQWYGSKILGLHQLIRFWAFVSQGDAPITSYAKDFWQTMDWHDQFSHRNLAPRVASTSTGKAPFIIYDATQTSLTDHLKSTPLTSEMVLGTLLAIAEALAYLHSTGLVHGRVWPDCLTFKSDELLRVIDYDDFSRTPPKSVSNPGKRTQPDAFSAPELFRSPAFLPSMDVFSFGLIIRYMFKPQTPRTTSKDILGGIVPPLTTETAADARLVTFGLGDLYKNCTNKDVSSRPSMKEVVITLLSIQGHPEIFASPTPSTLP